MEKWHYEKKSFSILPTEMGKEMAQNRREDNEEGNEIKIKLIVFKLNRIITQFIAF